MNLRSRRRVASLGVFVLAVAFLLRPVTEAAAQFSATSEQQAVDRGVEEAAADGIQQSVAVVDRTTGVQVASRGGREQYISESIVKLFTVAYYEVEHGGHPDDDLAATLRYMIIHSDDRIESSLWNTAIVPTMAARYGLSDTRNGPKTGPHDWGWELITADDEAQFLYQMSKDPQVAPLLMDAMAHVAATGSDGFNQHFGLNTLTGDHGSKQGWTDVGSTSQVQIHSVGWTDRYFVAILQTSTGAGYDTMRADSTQTAQLIMAAESTAAVRSSAAGSSAGPSSTGASPTGPTAGSGPMKLDPAVRSKIERELAAVWSVILDLLNSW